MARRDSDPLPQTDPLPGGLKHNPFASLRPPGSAPVPSAAAPAAHERSAPPPAPSAGRIQVRRERKDRGGKAVTLAEGPGLASTDLAELAREAARALGVGARVEAGALVVQGEQTERLCAWLAERGLGPITRAN